MMPLILLCITGSLRARKERLRFKRERVGKYSSANVFCFNYTNNLSNYQPIIQKFNGTDLERTLGAQPSDSDSINKTFNQTFSGNFQVGTSVINNESGCMQTTLFVNDRYQTNDFVEVLLTDNQHNLYCASEQNQIDFRKPC